MRPSSWPRSCEFFSLNSSIENGIIESQLPHPVDVVLGTAGLCHAGEDGRDAQQDDEGSHVEFRKLVLDFEDSGCFITKG